MALDPTARAAPLDAFGLDPAVVHLNHGSFGACPRAALAAQARWRDRIEAATMRFFVLEWQAAVDAARARIAAFVGAAPADVVPVPCATAGVATALDALVPSGGDVVTTDHAYAACRNALDCLAAARGARVVVAPIALPVRDPAHHVDTIVAAVTPATRLVLVDHVTSPTALVLDVAAIVAACAPRGIDVIVDGAHAPGMIDLDVAALGRAGCAAYVGNLHKWACAPKATGLLWVRDDLHARVHPLVTSHGFTAPPPERFHREHDWTGTHDPTPWLCAPDAIDEVARLGGGWPAARARNHAVAVAMRDALHAALGGAPAVPDAMLGSMAIVPVRLPGGAAPRAFERRLLEDGWEVPVIPWGDGALVRVSAHLYNAIDDAVRLAARLRDLGVVAG